MPDAETFWDRHAEGYAKRPIKDLDAYHRTMERTKVYLSESDQVLELGCGTGSTSLLLAGSVQHITATDISSGMIEIGGRKAKDQQVENVSFGQATPFDEGLAKGAFDVVLAYNFLHLLQDVPAAVARVHALVSPGGYFISKTVCLAEKTNFLRLPIYLMRKLGFAPYVSFLKIHQLEETIAAAGFEIIETGNYPASPPSRFIVARKI